MSPCFHLGPCKVSQTNDNGRIMRFAGVDLEKNKFLMHLTSTIGHPDEFFFKSRSERCGIRTIGVPAIIGALTLVSISLEMELMKSDGMVFTSSR